MRELDAVGDAIFFGEAAGVNEALGEFAFVGVEAETEINARVGGGLDLSEDMVAVKRNHGFAGAGFDVGAERFAEFQEFVVNGTEWRFFAGILLFDVNDGGGEIFFERVFPSSLPFCAFDNSPSLVVAEFVLGLQPVAASEVACGAVFFDDGDPFFESAAGFGLEVGDLFLDHGDAGMNGIERSGFSGGSRHRTSWGGRV